MSLNTPIPQWTDVGVWVIGASSGIGQATAVALAARGARVVVSARNASALDAMRRHHARMHAVPMDVTVPNDVVRAADEARRCLGTLDLVFYCAGHYRPVGAAPFDLNEMLMHQRVNVTGALHVLHQVLAPMVQRGCGHISLMGSVAGYRGLPKSVAYGPTKAALINLAEALHVELAPFGVSVSLINPGFVDTPLTARNQFVMPALMTPTQAAERIVAGWQRGLFEVHFPWRFTLGMKALRLLGYRVYFALVRWGTRPAGELKSSQSR